jgi:hypothetical protein
VNADGVAKHYGRLTPRERLPLIVAAAARGDELDRRRLMDSAPRVTFRVPDHAPRWMAFRELVALQRVELLNLAGALVGCYQAASPGGRGDAEAVERLRAATMYAAYLFNARVAGWRLFCGELHLPPDQFGDLTPGRELLDLANEIAAAVAFTAEEATEYVRLRTPGAGRAPTAEDMAAGWREAYAERVDFWA